MHRWRAAAAALAAPGGALACAFFSPAERKPPMHSGPVTAASALLSANSIAKAAKVGLPQELIEMGRMKLVAIDKYKTDKAAGKIKDEAEEAAKEAALAAAGGGKKKKFKNYGYVKKVVEEE